MFNSFDAEAINLESFVKELEKEVSEMTIHSDKEIDLILQCEEDFISFDEI